MPASLEPTAILFLEDMQLWANKIKENVCFAKFPFQSHKPHIAPKIAAMNIWYVDKHFSLSVVSNSLRPHGLQPTRLLCP